MRSSGFRSRETKAKRIKEKRRERGKPWLRDKGEKEGKSKKPIAKR
jgi:hypothetical protein